MPRMTPAEMAATIGGGLLSFPVTHFDAQQQFLEKDYREHCAWMLQHDLAGLFAAGGTGEFDTRSVDDPRADERRLFQVAPFLKQGT